MIQSFQPCRGHIREELMHKDAPASENDGSLGGLGRPCWAAEREPASVLLPGRGGLSGCACRLLQAAIHGCGPSRVSSMWHRTLVADEKRGAPGVAVDWSEAMKINLHHALGPKPSAGG